LHKGNAVSDLISIQSQIEKLQKQAEQLKAKEFDTTLQDIVAKMQAFGISLKDVQAALQKQKKSPGRERRGAKAAAPVAGKPRRKSAAAGKSVAAKYRGPAGETWSGRGLMPKWLKTLVDQGHKKEEYAVKG
jgi:DNA-binding protein H-NS